MPEEPRKIEPYYQAQGKNLVDSLFDLGLLSESLSRDGITAIEDLVALYFQQIGDSAAKCAGFTKKYKVLSGGIKGEPGHERHEEEMRWIARAREAEARVAELETQEIMSWTIEVGAFLKEILRKSIGKERSDEIDTAQKLYAWAVESGFFPMPDIMPGKIIMTEPPSGAVISN